MISSSMKQTNIPDIIKKRRSIRQYTTQKVEDEKIQAILEGMMYAPSARAARAWEFIVVKDWEIIQRLGSMKIHAEHAKGAQVVIVICSKEWKYWVEDASIIGSYVYLLATGLGLATCWVQILDSITMDGGSGEEYVKKLLNIPSDIRVLCMMPIGYSSELLPEHTPAEFKKQKIHEEKW